MHWFLLIITTNKKDEEKKKDACECTPKRDLPCSSVRLKLNALVFMNQIGIAEAIQEFVLHYPN